MRWAGEELALYRWNVAFCNGPHRSIFSRVSGGVLYILLSAVTIKSRNDISEEKPRQSELYFGLADKAANHAASVSQTLTFS